MTISSASTNSTSRWLYSPALDLIVGCGAWSLPLVLFSYFPAAASPIWPIAFYALALFLNYPHYMATVHRAYASETDFRKYRIFTVHITGIVLLAAVLSHLHFSWLPWIFTLYLTVSPWHYSGQNYGLFMMFVRRAGTQIDEKTRDAIYAAFVLSYAILFLSLHTGPSDRLFLSIGIPERAALSVRLVLTTAFLAASCYGLHNLIRHAGWRQMAAPLVLFSTQILWFLVPGIVAVMKGISLPQSRYSTGLLPLMHSAQYLWVTSYYARRASAQQGREWRPVRYFAILIVGGIALFVPGPWLASYAFHYDFTTSFLIFTALVNLHHFILDGAIWKLRDGRIASLLLQTRTSATSAFQGGSKDAGRTWRWMKSAAPGPRAFRIVSAVLLIGLAGVDQAWNLLKFRGRSLSATETAARLNPFDSQLELKLAQQHALAGDIPSAISNYERAINANPSDPVPRKALIQYLAATQRFPDAKRAAESALANWPDDPELLVSDGVLSSYVGRGPEARMRWEKALAIDPKQSAAHLYLAEQYHRGQQYGPAAEHYTAYLDQVAATRNRPDPGIVLPAVLKLAECDLRLDRSEQALKLYDLARNIAAQTRYPKLESVASLNQAILEAKAGKPNDAIRLYQNALKIDRSMNDPASEAADWQAYAAFLNSHGHDKKVAYACLVRAENLLHGSAGTLLPASLELQTELEPALGSERKHIRSNPGPLLEQALQLLP